MTKTGWYSLGLVVFCLTLVLATAPVFKKPLPPLDFSNTEYPTAQGEEKKPEGGTKLFHSIPFVSQKPRALIVYAEKELIPQKWLEEFENKIAGGVRIEQRPLPSPFSGQFLPLDGDVYSVSPRNLAVLCEKLNLAPFENEEFWGGVDPVFGGHPFDVDGRWTRPWRWTPYFFYVRDVEGVYIDVEKWWKETNGLWTRDVDLLTALRIKGQGRSANIKHGELWQGIRKELTNHLRVAEEDQCWKALKQGNASISFLPASFRVRAKDFPEEIVCRTSAMGTLVQLEVLVVSANSTRVGLARELVGFLMNEDRQKRLFEETGYFSVHEKVEKQETPAFLPRGKWFERSEFLLRP